MFSIPFAPHTHTQREQSSAAGAQAGQSAAEAQRLVSIAPPATYLFLCLHCTTTISLSSVQ